MQELNLMEVDEVSGGGLWKFVIESIASWGIGQAADGAVSWAVNQNQGGSPNGTDALGNNW